MHTNQNLDGQKAEQDHPVGGTTTTECGADPAEAIELPGVVAALGRLGASAVVSEHGLANLFRRHPCSVKRAVQRGELPPPVRMFGANVWTAGALVSHIERRLTLAAQQAEADGRKIARLSP